MKHWYQLCLTLPPEGVDMVSPRLFDVGCCGIMEADAPGVSGVRLTAYFDESADRGSVLRALETALDDAGLSTEIHIDDVPETDWSASWRAHFKPVYPTARMAICPPWDRVPDPPDGFTIVIEPKMAFGTGHHETTRLALAGLEKWVAPDDRVLDVGAGSGILSIAALKLGARTVTAVETDGPAIESAHENLAANAAAHGVELIHGSIEKAAGEFDVVVANIISSILIPLLPDVFARVRMGGRAILGGALIREQNAFLAAIRSSGFRVDETMTDGEWLCATALREDQ